MKIFSFIFFTANNDPEICPLEGSYSLRGLISPPYSSSSSSGISSFSRHKRNHNSKLHSNHHHSHDLSSLEGGGGSGSSRLANNNFKAHTSLSFRNEEDSLKSWHLNDHNKSLRQRRSTMQNERQQQQQQQSSESDNKNSIAPSSAFIEVLDDGSEVSDIDDNNDDDHQVIKLVRSKRNASASSSGVIEIASDAGANDATRSRRDTTINCGNVNNKMRQLNIGCSDETKIDVLPQCDDSEEGDYFF